MTEDFTVTYQNAASHTLTKLGRESKRTQLWLSSLPEEVEKIIRMSISSGSSK
jgi:hypothetical protein